jgi:hypothetical protein
MFFPFDASVSVGHALQEGHKQQVGKSASSPA